MDFSLFPEKNLPVGKGYDLLPAMSLPCSITRSCIAITGVPLLGCAAARKFSCNVQMKGTIIGSNDPTK